jgi:hypothetical protein
VVEISGLKVKDEKTDLCLFYKHGNVATSIHFGHVKIKSKSEFNLFGVLFESKLQWSSNMSIVISKANKALNAIKLIRIFFKSN